MGLILSRKGPSGFVLHCVIPSFLGVESFIRAVWWPPGEVLRPSLMLRPLTPFPSLPPSKPKRLIPGFWKEDLVWGKHSVQVKWIDEQLVSPSRSLLHTSELTMKLKQHSRREKKTGLRTQPLRVNPAPSVY